MNREEWLRRLRMLEVNEQKNEKRIKELEDEKKRVHRRLEQLEKLAISFMQERLPLGLHDDAPRGQ